MSEWISVKERLPVELLSGLSDVVLIWCPSFVSMAHRVNGKWYFHDERDYQGEWFQQEDVTHWMNLPEPPK